jgi:hypothetical protein
MQKCAFILYLLFPLFAGVLATGNELKIGSNELSQEKRESERRAIPFAKPTGSRRASVSTAQEPAH